MLGNTLVAALTAALVLPGFALAAEKTYEWKISFARPVNTSVDKDVTAFCERVLKESNGRIKISTYPNSQLGDYQVVQERVGVGSVEMALAMATRCCCPPESWLGRWRSFSESPTRRSISWARARRSRTGTPA